MAWFVRGLKGTPDLFLHGQDYSPIPDSTKSASTSVHTRTHCGRFLLVIIECQGSATYLQPATYPQLIGILRPLTGLHL